MTAPSPTPDDLKALRDAAEAATPGPWERAFQYHVVKDSGRHNCGTGPDGHFGAHEPACGLEQIAQASDADAAFIALANPATVLRLLDRLDAAERRADDAEAEAHNLGWEVDRCEQRLWRLAAKSGWTPGNPADNNATAELYVTDALKARDAAEAAVERVRALADEWRSAAEGARRLAGCAHAEEDIRAHEAAAGNYDYHASRIRAALEPPTEETP